MANNIDINIRASGGAGLQSIMQGIGQAAGQALANFAGKAVDYLSGAISKASDLNETISKNRTVFGEAANDLLAWADQAPRALGMTRQAALDATGSLGNLFTQLGIGSDEARKLSQANVQLATDFASFHNADPTAVLEAISAAYRGEYDALQRYVPVISAATVEQEALAMTHKKSVKELTAQEKALAVNAVMQKNAGAAAGDFARTSEGAANQARIASARFEEWQTKIGEKLLPAWTALLNLINNQFFPVLDQMMSKIDPAFQWLKDHPPLIAAAAAAIGVVLVGAFVALGVAAWSAAAGVIAATWPVLAIAAAVAALTAAVVYAYQNWDVFRNAVDAAVSWIRENVPPIFESVKQAAMQLYETAIKPLIEYIQANSEVFANLGKILLVIAAIIIGVVVVAIAAVIGAGLAMTAVVGVIIAALVALIAVIYNVIQWFWDLAKNIGSAIADAVRWVSGLPDRIKSAIGDLGSLLFDSGRAILQGLIHGFESALGWAKDKVAGGLSSIRNLFPFSPAKEGPFSGSGYTDKSGQALITDFGKGIESASTSAYNAAANAMAGTAAAFRGGIGGSGGVQLSVGPGANSAVATMIMHLVRTGDIQLTAGS